MSGMRQGNQRGLKDDERVISDLVASCASNF